MTSLMPSTPTSDQIDLSVHASTPQANGSTQTSKQSGRKAGSLTGLVSGNPDFDQLLNQLHAAFGELMRTDADTSIAAANAADDLSTTYTSITGRSHPQADDSAGVLAATLQHGLAALPTSLTGKLGQSMLRSL